MRAREWSKRGPSRPESSDVPVASVAGPSRRVERRARLPAAGPILSRPPGRRTGSSSADRVRKSWTKAGPIEPRRGPRSVAASRYAAHGPLDAGLGPAVASRAPRRPRGRRSGVRLGDDWVRRRAHDDLRRRVRAGRAVPAQRRCCARGGRRVDARSGVRPRCPARRATSRDLAVAARGLRRSPAHRDEARGGPRRSAHEDRARG